MDAPKGFNPYVGLSQQELNDKLLATARGTKTEKIILLIEAGADLKATHYYYKDSSRNVLESAAINNNAAITMINILLNAAKEQGINFFDKDYMNDLVHCRKHILDSQNLRENDNRIKTYYRLFCERTDSQLNAWAETSDAHRRSVARFTQELNENKMKVYQLVMPFLLKMDNTQGYNTLPSELLSIISGLVLKLQGDEGFPDWYQHRIERDVREACHFVIAKNKKEQEYCSIEPKASSPIITPLHDAKKRKAEDELEENGRNKRMRVETQDEQEQEMNTESSYFSFSNYCTLQ